MRNGQGDDYFALFNIHGCFFKGFAHKAPMTSFRSDPNRPWPGVFETVPNEFATCLHEPAFSIADTTFCIWRRYNEASWQRGVIEFPPERDPDGSEFLLAALDGNPGTYRDWAVDYFDKPFLTVEMVRHIYEQRPLTNDFVAAITQDLALGAEESQHLEVADLDEDISEIGYPM